MNYILFGIIIILCLYLVNTTAEGVKNMPKSSIMTKFGDGCCRYDGWEKNVKDKGYRTIPECMNLCSTDDNCWAIDYKNPKGNKYKCSLYTGEFKPNDLHLECDWSFIDINGKVDDNLRTKIINN